MAVVNSATAIFGAKLDVVDENLKVYELADSQNPFSAFQYNVASAPSHTEHVKRSLETSKIEKKAKKKGKI